MILKDTIVSGLGYRKNPPILAHINHLREVYNTKMCGGRGGAVIGIYGATLGGGEGCVYAGRLEGTVNDHAKTHSLL